MKKFFRKLVNKLKIWFCCHDEGTIAGYYLDYDFRSVGGQSLSEVTRGRLKCRCNKCGKMWLTKESVTIFRDKITGEVMTIHKHHRLLSKRKENGEDF